MEDDVIEQCRQIAAYAYRRAKRTTVMVAIAFAASVAVWIYVACNYASAARFGLSSVVMFIAAIATMFRLIKYGSFDRFLDTMSEGQPDSAFAIVQRERGETANADTRSPHGG